jgi:DNA-binding transcriptional ArsR family regulator
MGITKTAQYTAAQLELAAVAKVLGHPARIAILQQVLAAKSCINGGFVQEIGLAQATISQHLQELKAVGLIQGKVEGPAMSYCINAERWLAVQALLGGFFDQYVAPIDVECCAAPLQLSSPDPENT